MAREADELNFKLHFLQVNYIYLNNEMWLVVNHREQYSLYTLTQLFLLLLILGEDIHLICHSYNAFQRIIGSCIEWHHYDYIS